MNPTIKKSIFLELSAALLVPAALLGFIRVFENPYDILPILATTFLATALSVTLRRLGVYLLVSLLISFFALIGILVFQFARETAVLGIVPTGSTLDQFRILAQNLVTDFKQQTSPVPASDHFVAATMLVGWLMALLTDWGALRLRLAFEPVLPASLLFIFASISPINSEQNQVLATLIFGSAIAFWGVNQRYSRIQSQALPVNTEKSHGRFIITAGLVFSLLAVTAGGFLGHNLPGSQAEPIYDTGKNNSETIVTNPYIDLSTRLVDQTDTSLFTVSASKKSYWRMAGLDEYSNLLEIKDKETGEMTDVKVSTWGVKTGRDEQETSYIQPKNIPGEILEQKYEIRSLDTSVPDETNPEEQVIKTNAWVPAALSPIEIKDSSSKLDRDKVTDNITITAEQGTTSLSYTVISEIPAFSPEQLRSAAEKLQPETNRSDIYLNLPSSSNGREIPSAVQETAEEITAGTTNRYDQMLALQNYFQTFEYSTNLDPLNGRDAMEHFLETRKGFCQQFSGTFAVMARQLGVPSRVAVGFTWGDPILDESGAVTGYEVKGKHAHAWPEIWFGEELGWVPFEPTPGRGIPEASLYTGIPENQDSDEVEPIQPEETPEGEDPQNPPPEDGSDGKETEIPEPFADPDLVIEGYIWIDEDENGFQGEEDSAISGATVNFYDQNEELVASAVTDPQGSYTVGVYADTPYTIKLDELSDYAEGAPLEKTALLKSPADPTSSVASLNAEGFPEFTLTTGAANQNITDTDFGFTKQKDILFTLFEETEKQGFFAPLKSLPWKWIALFALLLSYPILLPLLYKSLRERRWKKIDQLLGTEGSANATSSSKLSWIQTNQIAKIVLGKNRLSSETTNEFVDRLANTAPLNSVPMNDLADAVTASFYNPAGVETSQAHTAKEQSIQIEKALKESIPTYKFYLRTLNPKNIFIKSMMKTS